MLGEVTCPVGGVSDLGSRGCGSVSAYRGWVAWTSYDTSRRAYVLWASSGGVARVLPVNPQPRPFDVDLGPDATGQPVAVFSRCDSSNARRCTIRNFNLATGEQTHLVTHPADDQLLPSRWGNRLAIARSWWNAWRDAEICRLEHGAAKCRPVRAGPVGAAPRARSTGPTNVDLSARRMAIAWRWQPRPGSRRRQRTAILLRREVGIRTDRRRRPRWIAATRSAGTSIRAVHTPMLEGAALYYARGHRTCETASHTLIVRYDLRRATTTRWKAPELAGVAVDGNRDGALSSSRCSASGTPTDAYGAHPVED